MHATPLDIIFLFPSSLSEVILHNFELGNGHFGQLECEKNGHSASNTSDTISDANIF